MFMFCSYCDIDQILYCRNTATLHIVFFDNKILKMDKSDSYDSKLSQARGLASQLGMFAEENDIPKDLWDKLEATIYDFYQISNDR